MEKQNDYFINLLYNPTFLAGDFQNVGLTSANTSIGDKDVYKKLDVVQNNDLFKTNGTFDENKFNEFYDKALLGYNQLSGNGHAERLATSYSAFRTDIFAKSSVNKTNGPETFITKIANPEGTSLGFVSRNIKGVQKLSARENAETHLFYDRANNIWTDAPNDTPINNFFNPKVLAQYDEDVDINGKTRGLVGFDANNIQYHKGDKKINPITGEYYYESLNGRNIYGREVLSGWDTLTVDGSAFNKYDFFDSDDLDKSDEGSFLKAAVKVAPALIPVISPWYIAARLSLSTADLVAKVGKMLPGVSSNNEILSYLEGLNAAWTESSSDAAGLHAWKLENIFNLGADVFTLLAEQRWIFKYSSALKNGKLGYDKKAQEKFVKDLEKKYYSELGSNVTTKLDIFDLPAIAKYNALAELEKRLKSTEKLSEYLSKLYMTGITTADSFGEAKEAGLSDAEAAIFTLVYGLGEYGILSTNLGEHILPELRADKVRWQNIAKTISGFKEEAKGDNRKLYLKIVDFAKQTVVGDYNDSKIAKALKTGGTKTAFALSMASNALGEGLEEVSEEAWLDLAKGLYNAASDLHMTSTGATFLHPGGLEEILNRYAMNFVGGLIGGGIAVGLPGFQDGIKNMLGANMDTKQAYLELVALIRNGLMDDFLKVAKKLELADSTKSARNYEIVGDKIIYKLGTETDNQNQAVLDILEHTVKMVNNLLNVNGLNIDDNSILRHLTEDGRRLLLFHRILGNDAVGSSILASYVLDYNTLATLITSVALELDALQNPAVDLDGKKLAITAENLQKITTLLQKLNKLLELRDMYLNGEMTKYALPAAIFEMSDFVSAPYLATNFKQYIEKVEGKPLEELTPERVQELREGWRWYKETQLSDDIRTAHGYFLEILKRFSKNLTEFNALYGKPQNSLGNLSTVFLETEKGILNTPGQIAEDILNNAQGYEVDSINRSVLANSNINATIKSIRSLVTALQELNPEDVSLLGILDKLNFLNLPALALELNTDLLLIVLKLAKDLNPNVNAVSDSVFNSLKELQRIDPSAVSQETILSLLLLINPDIKELNLENLNIVLDIKDSFGKTPLPEDLNTLTLELQMVLLEIAKKLNPTLSAVSDDLLNTLKDKYFKEAMLSAFVNVDPETKAVSFREEVKLVIQNIPYMNLYMKDFLKTNLLGNLQMYVELNDDIFDDYETNEDLMGFLGSVAAEIDKLPTTPIEQLADLFMLAIGEGSYKLSLLIKALQNLMRISVGSDSIGEFGYSDEVAELVDNALQILSLLEAHVLASRSDGKNIGNLFGYNAVVNLLIPEMKLAMIDKNTANIIMLDIAKLKQKLLYYLGIFKVNSGQKLSELSKINIRLKTAFIKRFKALVSALPDEWEKLDENGVLLLSNLKSLLEKCTTINTILDSKESNRFLLNAEKTRTFEKEYLNISNAIYDLFNLKDNLKRILDGELASIVDLLVLLPATDGSSTTFDGTNVNLNLETIDDRSFLWMLVSTASVKTSDFYAEYIKSINNKFAPIPGQELAIKMAYSFLLNKPMFNAFSKAYNNKFLKELETVDSDLLNIKYGKNALKDAKLDSDYAVQMFNTFLVEGIPGAGKSTGYYSVLIDMLKQNHKEFLNNVWVIHTDAIKAAKFAESIGLDPAKVTALDKNSYLKKICPEHLPPTVENGVISLSINELNKDSETGLHHYKNETLSLDSNIPTLIIMDESTRFSLLDFLLSEKFLLEHGISALATGDYDLLGAFGSTKIDEDTILMFKTSSDNFIHSPKLGTSMRTDNKIKDVNIQTLRNQRLGTINALTNGDVPEPIQLSYFESDEGLWGEKKVASISEAEVIKLLNTLREGELLLYVYLNDTSDTYKIIEKLSKEEAYKNKLIIKNSNDSLGDEAKYAIIETLPLELKASRDKNELIYNSLYTGITRSILGTLIVGNLNLINTLKVKTLTKSPLSAAAILLYATSRKELLLSLLTGDEKKTKIVGRQPTPPNVPPTPPVTPPIASNDTPTAETGSSTTEEEADTLNNEKVVTIENGNNNEYNMLLHSMPISETGFVLGENGLEIPDAYKERIDSLNGLTKLGDYRAYGLTDLSVTDDGKLLDERAALNILTKLTLVCLYEKDIDKIKEEFRRLLNLNSDVDFGINFGYMTWGEREEDSSRRDPKYKRFFRGVKEKLYGVFTGTKYKDKDLAVLRHGIVANLYIKEKTPDGKTNRKIVTTLPLSIFTSPLTMLNTKGLEHFRILFDTMTGDLGHRMQSFKDLLSDENEFDRRIKNIPGITQEEIKRAKANRPKLLKHFILYTSRKDEVVFFPDDFVFAQQFQSLGPNITTKDKGNEYEQPSEMFVWKGEYMNLKDVDLSIHHLSNNVYYTTEDIVINGKVVIKAGHGFVLCNDIENIGNEQKLLEQFAEGELKDEPEGRISLLYTSSPGVTIDEYLYNFALKYIKDGQINKDFGNYLTDIKIASAITKEDSEFSKVIIPNLEKDFPSGKTINDLNPNDESRLKFERWSTFKAVMRKVETDLEGKSFEELKALLSSKMSQEYLDMLDQKLKHTYSNKGLTLKLFILHLLCSYILKPRLLSKLEDITGNGKLTITSDLKPLLEAVDRDTSKIFKNGIYVNLTGQGSDRSVNIERNGVAVTFVPVSHNNNYEIDVNGLNRPIRINGKIDTTMHYGNVSDLMDYILNGINKFDGLSKKRYFGEWIESSKSNNDEGALLFEGLKGSYDEQSLEILKNLCKNNIKTLLNTLDPKNPLSTLFSFYSTHGYLVSVNNDKLHLRKDNSGDSFVLEIVLGNDNISNVLVLKGTDVWLSTPSDLPKLTKELAKNYINNVENLGIKKALQAIIDSESKPENNNLELLTYALLIDELMQIIGTEIKDQLSGMYASELETMSQIYSPINFDFLANLIPEIFNTGKIYDDTTKNEVKNILDLLSKKVC